MAAKTVSYQHRLRFDPAVLKPGEEVLQRWPDLAVSKALVDFGMGEGDKFLRYVIYTCDGGSGLLRISDLSERKAQAATLAGIKKSDPRLAKAFTLEDRGVKAMSLAWLKMQQSAELAFWLSGTEMVWQDIEKLREPIGTFLSSGSEDGDLLTELQSAARLGSRKMGKFGQKGGDEKETDIQRAYKLRGELFDAMPARLEKLKKAEYQLFAAGDDSLRDLAIASSRVEADDDSIEAHYLGGE